MQHCNFACGSVLVLSLVSDIKNRVLRIISGPKKDEVMGGLRKLHNEEFQGLYSSPSIFRMLCAAQVAGMRNRYRLLVGN
jgi:hypothetical protein